MAEDPFTFKIWITLLAACGPDGIAECSAMYLESICRIPMDQVKKSLEILSNPDNNSRSVNESGKRIERVNGGFKIINYLKYRDLSLKSAEAERKRLYRQQTKCPDTSGQCPDSSASAYASESSFESSSEEVHKEKPYIIIPDHLKQIWPFYLEMRKLIKKPATLNAQESTIKKLQTWYPGDHEKQIKCVQQSIDNSWQGVFELKEVGDGHNTGRNKAHGTGSEPGYLENKYGNLS